MIGSRSVVAKKLVVGAERCKREAIQRGASNLSGVMSILIVMMVSQMFTCVKTYYTASK